MGNIRNKPPMDPLYGTQWYDELEMQFSVVLRPEQRRAWWARMTDAEDNPKAFESLTNAEVIRAIQWAADPTNIQLIGKPGLRDICKWVKLLRHSTSTTVISGCTLCSSNGLVQFWPDIADRPEDFEDMSSAYSVSIPCLCPRGEAIMAHHGYTTAPAVERHALLFARARKQNDQRRKFLEKAFPRDQGERRPGSKRYGRALESILATAPDGSENNGGQ